MLSLPQNFIRAKASQVLGIAHPSNLARSQTCGSGLPHELARALTHGGVGCWWLSLGLGKDHRSVPGVSQRLGEFRGDRKADPGVCLKATCDPQAIGRKFQGAQELAFQPADKHVVVVAQPPT